MREGGETEWKGSGEWQEGGVGRKEGGGEKEEREVALTTAP